MRPLPVAAFHSKADGSEHPVKSDDDSVQRKVDTDLHILVQLRGRPIHNKAQHQDGEPKGRIVMMDISNTTHQNKGQVVEEPSNDWVETGVVDLIEIIWVLDVFITTLPAN